MHFEASLNKKKYSVHVRESRTHWMVSLERIYKTEREATVKDFKIPKRDFTPSHDGIISFLYKNKSYLIDVTGSDTDYTVYTRGSHRQVKIVNDEKILHENLRGKRSMGGQENLKAGMPGKIVKILVKEGQKIEPGTPLLIIEAMKMENEMKAQEKTKINRIFVKEGENVVSGANLISFKS